MPDNPGVRIDIAHADLLYGLVRAHKPASVLEFGFGGGRSTDALLRGLKDNGTSTRYVLVDGWQDWGGDRPAEAQRTGVEFVEMSEEAFVAGCSEQFEFIMSDADHENTQRWFGAVYDDLLKPGGVLVYHDVRAYPGLGEIVSACERLNLRYVVFDRNSVVGEACQRGLLVVFRPQE